MSVEENTTEDLNQFLTFILDSEEYGIPILKVSGIQGWEKTTPIPNSPDYVLGIINLRGEVVPIIDLRKRFGLDEIPYDSHTVVIVVKVEIEGRHRTVGLVVDAVADVHDIKLEDMRSTPEFCGKVDNNFIQGLGMIEEKMVIILEIDCLVDWSNVTKDEVSEADMSNIKADEQNMTVVA